LSPHSEGTETARDEQETSSRRQELDFVAVPMDDSKQEVYGWMCIKQAKIAFPASLVFRE
jgi:hypothetical protein